MAMRTAAEIRGESYSSEGCDFGSIDEGVFINAITVNFQDEARSPACDGKDHQAQMRQ
jgi:hypothetical protein